MGAQKINEYIFMIDLKPANVENFIASYVVTGRKTAIIETGPTSTVNNLLEGLKELNIDFEDIAYLMVSHIHLDHGGGAGTLLRYLPNAKVVVHPRGIPHLINPEKLWVQAKQVLGKIAEIYGEPLPVPESRLLAAEDNMQIDLGNGIEIQIIETLGHASHHVSYYDTKSGILFPGDTAGIYVEKLDVILPTTPPLLFLPKILESLGKLIKLAPKKLCYTHFGAANNAVGKLEAYLNQLKLWASIIREGLKNGESLEVISRRIVKRDSAVKKAMEYFRNHPIMNYEMLMRDIQGFVAYFQKYGMA